MAKPSLLAIHYNDRETSLAKLADSWWAGDMKIEGEVKKLDFAKEV